MSFRRRGAIRLPAILLGAALLMWAQVAAAAPSMMETIFLDPQESWPFEADKVAGQPGKFYINGQNEGVITVFDASSQERLNVINFWEYERNLLKAQGKTIDDATDEWIQKNVRPHHSWVAPGGRYNYVSNKADDSDRFWVVDTWTDEIVAHFNTGGMGPLHGAFSPYRKLAVWGNVMDRQKGIVTFIDTQKHEVIGHARTTGTRTRDVVFTPDNQHIYVTNQGWSPGKGDVGGVDMIDLDSREVVKTFPIPGSKGMKMTYDGKLAGVTSFRLGYVAFIDATQHEVVGMVQTGGKPNNIAFHPNGKKAYVGLYGTNEFVVIDLEKMAVKARIPAGKEANAVYIPPGRDDVGLGTNENADFVTVIDIQKDEEIKKIYTPLGTHNVAYSADGKVGIISCKRSREAVFIDMETLEEISTYRQAGYGNNGVRWFPYRPGLGPDRPYKS